jgi:hypothetical protein
MRLSSHNVEFATLGYGEIGLGGKIGFADLYASVANRHYPNAIGAHAPSKLTFALPQGMQGFATYVALNDTAEPEATADFLVYADDELIAATHAVRSGETPRLLEGELYGAKKVHLVINTLHWPGCHTLWIDPLVTRQEKPFFTGVLGEIDVPIGSSIEYCDTCIAIIVTDGYETMAESMLGSLWDNGGCRDASILIITDSDNTACQHLASKFNAIVKYITRIPKDTYIIKSIAYSVARMIRANNYIVLDVDMIVTNSLNPLLSSIGVVPPSHILICKEQEGQSQSTLLTGIDTYAHPYFGKPGDLANLKVTPQMSQHCPVFNGGVMAGRREAFLGLESAMRDLMPFSGYWEKQEVYNQDSIKVKWREQGVMNASLARTGKWSELSGVYNCQLAVSNHPFELIQGAPSVIIDNQQATIIHFNGVIGRTHYSNITHNYRDGIKKPFGTTGQNGTSESTVLGAKLFRACYRPTASKAFHSIDSFWDYQGLWSLLWESISEHKNPRVLDVNTLSMCTSVIAMRATESCMGHVEIITKSQPPEWFVNIAGSRIKIGDVELLVNQNQDDSKRYDIICIDTSSNARMLMNLLNISKSILEPGGSLLLLDIQHPVNDVSVILDKMRREGWIDKLVFSHPSIALYKLTRNE